MTRHLAFALLLLWVALPAAAQNLLANPAFTADTVGWEVPAGLTLGHSDTDGFDATGAAEVEGVLMQGFQVSSGLRQCVDLTGIDLSQPLAVNAAVKPVNHAGGQPSILVSFLEDTECLGLTGNLADTSLSGIPTAEGQWSGVAGSVGIAPAGAGSARISVVLFTDATAPDTLSRFDDVFFGVPPVFTDGFESGNTTAWSSTTP